MSSIQSVPNLEISRTVTLSAICVMWHCLATLQSAPAGWGPAVTQQLWSIPSSGKAECETLVMSLFTPAPLQSAQAQSGFIFNVCLIYDNTRNFPREVPVLLISHNCSIIKLAKHCCFACFISSFPPASFRGFKDWSYKQLEFMSLQNDVSSANS